MTGSRSVAGLPKPSGVERGLDVKGHEGILWGDENVIYLDCHYGYRSKYTYQILSNVRSA